MGLLCSLICVTSPELVAAGRIIYVDANASGANDGSSWTDAYNYLQDAFADANSNGDVNEIWVAEGIYKPDKGGSSNTPGDRTATFQLINGVAIRGGYGEFGAVEPNARDVNGYETILSGDLDGNDVEVIDPCDLLDEPTRSENSYHVVTGSGTDETAVLDGFTITASTANGSYPDGSGGGMYNDSGSNDTAKLYIDGDLPDDGTKDNWNVNEYDESDALKIGFANNNFPQSPDQTYFYGRIDDVHIYDYVLDDANIAALYFLGKYSSSINNEL